jgi:hypothetical protein
METKIHFPSLRLLPSFPFTFSMIETNEWKRTETDSNKRKLPRSPPIETITREIPSCQIDRQRHPAGPLHQSALVSPLAAPPSGYSISIMLSPSSGLGHQLTILMMIFMTIVCHDSHSYCSCCD